jgi:hypothetical protein
MKSLIALVALLVALLAVNEASAATMRDCTTIKSFSGNSAEGDIVVNNRRVVIGDKVYLLGSIQPSGTGSGYIAALYRVGNLNVAEIFLRCAQ